MSFSKLETIRCSKCSRQSQVEVLESINGTLYPNQRQALLAGKLFRFECKHCRFKVKLDRPLLYHDMHRRFMIWWISPPWEQAGFQPTPTGTPLPLPGKGMQEFVDKDYL